MKIKVKEILEQRCLTIRQAAELCGMPKSTIGDFYENISKNIKSIDKTCVCYYYINKHTFTKEKGAVHTNEEKRLKEKITELLGKITEKEKLQRIYKILERIYQQ